LQQEKDLHDHEHTHSTEQHYASLSTELLAIAKEADRDVWEQRNNQYSQMLVCAVLMFGVAVGNINEGTYKFDKYVDAHGLEFRSFFSRDGAFILLGAVGISSLFLCIVACLLIMGRMSTYMIQRSSNLVDRLSVCTTLAHRIVDRSLSGESALGKSMDGRKNAVHSEIGKVIGAQPGVPFTGSHRLDSESSEESPSHSEQSFTSAPYWLPSKLLRRPPTLESPSRMSREKTQSLLKRNRGAPLNFSMFYREYCAWLHNVIVLSFVAGVACTWGALWFLLWNQFPNLLFPIFTFLLVAFMAVVASGQMAITTWRGDTLMKYALHEGGIAAPRAHYVPPSSPVRMPTPPPSPPPMKEAHRPCSSCDPSSQLATSAVTEAVSRPAALRLQELDGLQTARLITAEEYAAKRADILAAL